MTDPRYCSNCGHTGNDDDADMQIAACYDCAAVQREPCPDYCYECEETGVMGVSCPVCNGPYLLDDDRVSPNT